MHLQCNLCTLCLPACQVRVAVGDSGLCCCVSVTSFECYLTPLFVDSVQVLLASFCFRVLHGQVYVLLCLAHPVLRQPGLLLC